MTHEQTDLDAYGRHGKPRDTALLSLILSGGLRQRPRGPCVTLPPPPHHPADTPMVGETHWGWGQRFLLYFLQEMQCLYLASWLLTHLARVQETTHAHKPAQIAHVCVLTRIHAATCTHTHTHTFYWRDHRRPFVFLIVILGCFLTVCFCSSFSFPLINTNKHAFWLTVAAKHIHIFKYFMVLGCICLCLSVNWLISISLWISKAAFISVTHPEHEWKMSVCRSPPKLMGSESLHLKSSICMQSET